MRTRKLLITLLSTIAMIFFSTQMTFAEGLAPWNVKPFVNGEAMLDPGETTYCKKDFTVTNMSKKEAHVHVILGNGDSYWFELYPSKGKKSYSLESGTPFSTPASKGHEVKEARIVNSTAGDSLIKIHC